MHGARLLRRGAARAVPTAPRLRADGVDRRARLARHRSRLCAHAPIVDAAASPNGWIAAATTTGSLVCWDDKRPQLGEVKADIGPITSIDRHARRHAARRRHNRRRATRHETRACRARDQADGRSRGTARLGPGADEITRSATTRCDRVGLRRHERRKLDDRRNGIERVRAGVRRDGASTCVYAHGRRLVSIDLDDDERRRSSPSDFYGEPAGRHGTRFAYMDNERRIHLIDGRRQGDQDRRDRGEPTVHRVLRRRRAARRHRDTRARRLFDGKGAITSLSDRARAIACSLLRGDDAWITRQRRRRAPLPRGRARLVDSRCTRPRSASASLGGNALATLGNDSTLIIVRADAQQVIEATRSVQARAVRSSGVATGYACNDDVTSTSAASTSATTR